MKAVSSPRWNARRNVAEFMLACYCEATGCSKISVRSDAIIAVITSELAKNAGIRKRYEKVRAEALKRERVGNLQVVK